MSLSCTATFLVITNTAELSRADVVLICQTPYIASYLATNKTVFFIFLQFFCRATASGILLSVARIGAILGTLVFGLFINTHPSIPILIAGSCFVVAAICCLPLPATNRKTLLE